MRSGAATMKYAVGAPFFSDPYFGFALTWMISFGLPSSSTTLSRSYSRSFRSPRIAPRFLPVVIAPHPPIEWKRTAIACSGRSDGASSDFTS